MSWRGENGPAGKSFTLDELIHTGVAHDENPPGRGSGRYAYGSGENPYQHQFTFLSEVSKLKKAGLTDSEIARELLGVKRYLKDGTPIYANTNDLRARIAIEGNRQRKAEELRALKLYDECDGNVSEVARRMGKNESSVRLMLKRAAEEREDKYTNTAELLKKRIAEKGVIDISSDTELYMGVTGYTKDVAVAMLEQEGYVRMWVQVPIVGTDKKRNVMVLAAPPGEGETVKDVYRRVQQNKLNIGAIEDFSPDGGKTFWTPEFPESVDSKRIYVRYAEDGGTDMDGVVQLRKGVPDLSLGNSSYAQVRIAVDGTNYIKGMAIYGDDIPDGYDLVVNTNKHRGTPLIDETAEYDAEKGVWSGKEVLKRMKINKETGEVDEDNPFGGVIKSEKEKDGMIMPGGQSYYIGSDGKKHLSPINKLQDEGDWDSWSRTLSAQFLSKQPYKLVKQQLDISTDERAVELEKIMALNNPVVKQKLLDDFASNCDSAAAKLSATGFKNQAFQVLLPVVHMKEDEIYAPNFDDGDIVAVVRYPHAGIFEIPVLKVNNRNEEAKSIMGNARDAVGISPKVAPQLSGADFDGDTGLIIPLKSNRINLKTRPYLDELKGFDAKELYKLPDDAPPVKNDTKQLEMGKVTNLIADMTLSNPDWSEVARAVKHSMVVIDSEKHHLDYKKSEEVYNIRELKYKYQGTSANGEPAGASTIITKARSDVYIPKRKEITNTKIMTEKELADWNAGKKVYRNTGETKLKLVTNTKKMTPTELEAYNAGKKVYRQTDKPKMIKVAAMDTVDDARDLVRDKTNEIEMAYADYANSLKGMANKARQASRSIKPIPVSAEAKKTYAKEVEYLNAELRLAKLNNPRERQAQALAEIKLSEKIKSNPDMDYEHRQKEAAIQLTKARAAVGASKHEIKITDSAWEAIQANAVSTQTLKAILRNANQDRVRQLATPKKTVSMTQAEIHLAYQLLKSGQTNKEVADRFGVLPSTVSKLLSQNGLSISTASN